MNPARSQGCCGIGRRGFVLGAGAGLAAGALGASWAAVNQWAVGSGQSAVPTADCPLPTGLPGPFAGKVVEVQHADSVRSDWSISQPAVNDMVDRGMKELVAADHPVEAWKKFFQPGDVVGIKVNPVGRAHRPGQASAISSRELVIKVVEGLKSAGVRAKDIILFERYAKQFRDAGYDELTRTRPMDGVRWFAASWEYTNEQLDIEGYDRSSWDRDPHVVGYDPDIFVSMGYASPVHDPKDDRRFRSHMSLVVSRLVNKIVNLPVLKDHGSAGVTLALKNLSHGFFNNVARSHLPHVYRGDGFSRPNQCNTFIPTVLAQPLVRQKVVLHIMDGLVGVWQGGPSSTSGCNWARKSLFFATDPVAMDHVGWDIVDAKRVEKGLPPTAKTGKQIDPNSAESLDRRQPEHIILAGTIGLGKFDRGEIDYRRIQVEV